MSDSLPSLHATDAELTEWFLSQLKTVITPPPRETCDIRGVTLGASLRDVLTKIALNVSGGSKLIPSGDDVKTPHDYWAFLEPIFSTPLRSIMVPSVLSDSPTDIVKHQFPHYSWQWAMEDCVDSSLLSEEARLEILASFPVEQEPGSLINEELIKTSQALSEVEKPLTESFGKLRKWISQSEHSETALQKKKNANLSLLASFCQDTLLHALEKEQMLESIEELHYFDESAGSIAVIIDEIERGVKCFVLSEGIPQLMTLLAERNKIIGGCPQVDESFVQFSFPFGVDAETAPKIPQIGPFCHMCRQRRAESSMPLCNNKLPQSVLPGGFGQKGSILCHRRFCLDCLTMYNWPKPGEPVNSSATTVSNWKCPICLKLCTCDRCVRNVFIKSVRGFVANLKGAGNRPPMEESNQPIQSIEQFSAIIGPHSQFLPRPLHADVETAASPASPTVTAGRTSRRTSEKFSDDIIVSVQKRNKK